MTTMSTAHSKRCKCGLSYDGESCPLCPPKRPAPVATPPKAPALTKPLATKRHLIYLNRKAVARTIRENGRRAGEDFLQHLDEWIHRKITRACEVRNGGKKTLDVTVAGHVGIK